MDIGARRAPKKIFFGGSAEGGFIFLGNILPKGDFIFGYKISKRKYIFLFDNYGRSFLKQTWRPFFGNILPKKILYFVLHPFTFQPSKTHL